MNKQSGQTFAVVGAGRVGKTIARLVDTHTSLIVGDIINNSHVSAEESVRFIGNGIPASDVSSLQAVLADVVLISTPDDKIADVARSLAGTDNSLKGKLIFHCSGSLSSGVLSPVAIKGAYIASIHPLKSFSSPEDAVRTFSGTYCAVEGDPIAVAQLTELFETFGGTVFPITTEAKVLYHSAAVITCNYLYALIDIGLGIAEQINIPKESATQFLTPLIQGTLDSATQHGPRAALTGPIARGELETTRNQLDALQSMNPAYAEVYRALGKITASMAFESASISRNTRESFMKQFSDE